MDASSLLEFSYTMPVDGETQELAFSGIHRCGDLDIHLSATAPIDASGIDTSDGDVETMTPVALVYFEVKDGAELLYDLSIDRAGLEVFHAVHPRVRLTEYLAETQRCRDLAAVVFERGLVVTWFMKPKGRKVAP